MPAPRYEEAIGGGERLKPRTMQISPPLVPKQGRMMNPSFAQDVAGLAQSIARPLAGARTPKSPQSFMGSGPSNGPFRSFTPASQSNGPFTRKTLPGPPMQPGTENWLQNPDFSRMLAALAQMILGNWNPNQNLQPPSGQEMSTYFREEVP